MAAQCVSLALLLLSCLIAVASPAAIHHVMSLGDGEDLNLMTSVDLEGSPLNSGADDLDLLNEDRTPLVDEEKPYVDASVFRQSASSPADSVKPKASFFTKKATPDAYKHAKQEHEVKKSLSVKLEPPVEEKPSEDIDDVKLGYVLSAIHRFIEVAGRNIVLSLSSETTTAAPETDTTAAPTTTTSGTSAPNYENSELPRLSPPIWSHSSQAEILSDPLRLPLVEPYDRYDRYSHSIARDAVW